MGWSSPRRHQLFLKMAATHLSLLPGEALNGSPAHTRHGRRRTKKEVFVRSCRKNTGILMTLWITTVSRFVSFWETAMWETFCPCRVLRSTSPSFVSQASCFMCFFLQDLRFCMPKLLCEEFSEEIFEKVDIFEKADIEEIGMGFKYAMCQTGTAVVNLQELSREGKLWDARGTKRRQSKLSRLRAIGAKLPEGARWTEPRLRKFATVSKETGSVKRCDQRVKSKDAWYDRSNSCRRGSAGQVFGGVALGTSANSMICSYFFQEVPGEAGEDVVVIRQARLRWSILARTQTSRAKNCNPRFFEEAPVELLSLEPQARNRRNLQVT